MSGDTDGAKCPRCGSVFDPCDCVVDRLRRDGFFRTSMAMTNLERANIQASLSSAMAELRVHRADQRAVIPTLDENSNSDAAKLRLFLSAVKYLLLGVVNNAATGSTKLYPHLTPKARALLKLMASMPGGATYGSSMALEEARGLLERLIDEGGAS